ncbi:MAG: sensor histidine kinase [Vallitalea sp.]|jgi:signal transduction histidine kinase|nr:sensor histidine kinase [Vallitalea sp.]
MTLLKYIRDRAWLIAFYILNLLIINLVIIFDEHIVINIKNVIYMDMLSFSVMIIYLLVEYKKYYKIFKNIQYKINHNHFEKFDLNGYLPYIEKDFYSLFNEFYTNIQKDKKEIETYSDEFNDFITSWVHAVKIPIAASRLLIESNQELYEDNTLLSIENEIDRIERYVEQTLYYSRSSSFSKDYLIEEYNLNSLVKQSVKKFAKIFIAKKVSLSIDIDDSILVYTDKKWFNFILEQLFSNALKYSEDINGKIEIKALEDNKEIRLIIRDNGTGIKKEDIRRVFERGFTGFNGRYYEKSTGMGLYLAKKLAHKLGHKLSIESDVNVFTSVTIHMSVVGEYLLK